MLSGLLLLGVVLGVKHALEADHVAAVSSLVGRSSPLKDNVKLAAAWGAGHGLSILVLGSALVALGATLPERLVALFDLAVGVALIVLGANVLRRLRADRIHVHAHRHDGVWHVHVHGHAGETGHDPTHHRHEHPPRRVGAAALVGGLHGLAGSAAAMLLTTADGAPPLAALGRLLAFAAGTVLGMVLFTLVISLPLRLPVVRLGGTRHALDATVGTLTIAFGCWIAADALSLV